MPTNEGNARGPGDAPTANTGVAQVGSVPQAKETGDPPNSAPPGDRPHNRRRQLLMGGAAILILAAVLCYGVPCGRLELNTISTDDAYVNSHVTFVAPRVAGRVSKVFVDNNRLVKKGDMLVQLDKKPYEVQLAIKEAAVVAAKSDLMAAKAQVRALGAQARSQRWQMEYAVEQVKNQIALFCTCQGRRLQE